MNRAADKREQWLNRATGGIRFSYDRRAVREELEAHLEDKAADLLRIFPAMSQEEAESRALEGVGDAEELRGELARVHKPWLGRAWLCSKVLLGVLILLLAARVLYTDHYYGTLSSGPLWDWDDLPALSDGYLSGVPGVNAQWYTGEAIYTPGTAPEQIFARSYRGTQDVEVNGQTISLRRAALWQGEEGQELFVYLRVQDWRFWERAHLEKGWFVVTDSLGKRYNVGWAEEHGLLSSGEYGPFFEGWQLYLEDVNPEAEWVRVEYGLAEPIFSFTVELERG